MKNIVIIGSGGLATEVKCLIDAINRNQPQWNLLGSKNNISKKYFIFRNTTVENLFSKFDAAYSGYNDISRINRIFND